MTPLAVLLLATLAQASPSAEPTLPAGVQVLYTTQATGVQIYACTAQPGAAPQWTLQAPDATLTLPGMALPVAHHGAGPTWTWFDGSSVTGKVVSKTDSPDPASIPTLLLATSPKPGSSGVLNVVTFIRRSDTHGGAAPATPGDPRTATPLGVPYTATYTFYIPYSPSPASVLATGSIPR